MSILDRYIIRNFMHYLGISLLAFCFLFLVVDFFDRIDNVLEESAGLVTTLKYFLFKIPVMIRHTLPIAVLVATMLTIGLLSRNSEVTAMRASGITVYKIARPVLLAAFFLSLGSIFFNETLVPYCARRVREIYNIDIKKKDETGSYSQEDFWWRNGKTFYTASFFDSRTNTLLGFSKLDLTETGEIRQRTDAAEVRWLDSILGWNMKNVVEFSFTTGKAPESHRIKALPLPISETPKDFYDAKTDPQTMSFFKLRRFIQKQHENGVAVSGYLADLHAKISFPFVIFIVSLVAIPFALIPARSGSMAISFLAGLGIGFMYFAVHSFSLALGRAEIWPPLLAAWMANIVMGLVGVVLNAGAESPS